MYRSSLLLAGLLGSGLPVAAEATCVELQSWSAAPAELHSAVTASLGPVAERGERFNATDVIREGLRRNRFFGACLSGGSWGVAIERGGRGYHLVLLQVEGGIITRQATSRVPATGFTPALVAPVSER